MEDNIEILIEEVEKRPGIYDKSSKDYSNINIKKQLWEEVYAAVVPDWNELDGENKTKAGLDIQRKWQSLRNCFTRELRNQKNNKMGQKRKRRRTYIYFDKLLFLLSSVENRETRSNVEDQASVSEAETLNGTTHDEVREERRGGCSRQHTMEIRKENYEEPILKTPQQKMSTDTDEDIHFALSLVPMLQSLDEYKKIDAKIQILNLLKSIKWPGMNQSSQYYPFMLNQPYNIIPHCQPYPQHLPGPSGVQNFKAMSRRQKKNRPISDSHNRRPSSMGNDIHLIANSTPQAADLASSNSNETVQSATSHFTDGFYDTE